MSAGQELAGFDQYFWGLMGSFVLNVKPIQRKAMNKPSFLSSKFIKVLIGLFVVVCAIKIYTAGYSVGQWLHGITH
jgi:hypothetical protein